MNGHYLIDLTLICMLLATSIDVAITVCGVQHSPSFKYQLEDTSVHSGQNASFICVVSNFNRDTDVLHWLVGPYISNKKEVEIYASSINEFSSTITAFAVPQTNFYFSCRVDYLSRSGESGVDQSSGQCRISTSATLTVEYFPDAGDLVCSPTHPLELHAGDVVHVQCRVSRSEPAVSIIMKFNDTSKGHLRPRLRDVGLTRTLSYDLVVQKEYHLSTILCVVTSKVSFPSRKLECQIGPLRVFQPPIVSVYPQHTVANEFVRFELRCLTYSFPVVTLFSWSCSPEGILRGCNGSLETLSLLANTIASPINVTVTCTATNQEGTNTSDAIVLVEKFEGTTDNAKTKYSVEMYVKVDIEANCLMMTCLLHPNKTDDNVNFQWSIDSVAINRSSLVKQGPRGESSIEVFDWEGLNEDSQLTCRVNFSGFMIEETKTLSNIPISVSKITDEAKRCERKGANSLPNNVLNKTLAIPSKSDADEVTSTTNMNNDFTSKSFGLSLSTKKLLMIVFGVIVGFLITLLTVALTISFIFRYFRKKTNRNLSNNEPSKAADGPNEKSEEHPGYYGAYSDYEPTYEIPNTPPAFLNTDVPLPNQDHTYETATLPGNISSSRTSSEISFCSSSSSLRDSVRAVSLVHEYADSIKAVVYGNESVIITTKSCGKGLPAASTKVQARVKECMKVPIPPFPSSYNQ